MSEIIFSKNSGLNNVAFGKMETPIKMLLQAESDAFEKQKSILSELFNVEKSTRFGETLTSQTEFGEFMAAAEGAGAERDSVQDGFNKFIEHIQFMKEFVITAEMAEDSVVGISSDAQARAKAFIKAYERTKIALAARALANGDKNTMTYNNATVDLKCADAKPVFCNAHPYKKTENSGETQSNFFYGDFSTNSATIETALTVLSNKLRNFKDENLTSLEYVADTIILPSNRPHFEAKVKKVVGSERTPGTNDNDINIQYGNWKIVVLPHWETQDDRFILMSSDANEDLRGNMFFNRVALNVVDWEDHHTGNFIWTGRTRLGVGFNSWKHMLLAVSSSTAVTGATAVDFSATED